MGASAKTVRNISLVRKVGLEDVCRVGLDAVEEVMTAFWRRRMLMTPALPATRVFSPRTPRRLLVTTSQPLRHRSFWSVAAFWSCSWSPTETSWTRPTRQNMPTTLTSYEKTHVSLCILESIQFLILTNWNSAWSALKMLGFSLRKEHIATHATTEL